MSTLEEHAKSQVGVLNPADQQYTIEDEQERLLYDGLLFLSSSSFPFLRKCQDFVDFEYKCMKFLDNSVDPMSTLRIGVACLSCFVQDNFTGPSYRRLSFPEYLRDGDARVKICEYYLRADGPPAYLGCKNPFLLLIAKWIFIDNYYSLEVLPTSVVWAVRTIRIWQHLFVERQIYLYHLFRSYLMNIHNLNSKRCFSKKMQAIIWVELVELCCYYSCFEDASIALRECVKTFRLFPVKPQPQSSLKFRNTDLPGRSAKYDCDDGQISGITHDSKADESDALKKCALFAYVLYARSTSPAMESLDKELNMYTDELIGQSVCWSVRASAISLRYRVTQRDSGPSDCVQQLRDLMINFGNSDIDVRAKFKCAFASCISPYWTNILLLIDTATPSEACVVGFQFFEVKAWDYFVRCLKRASILGMATNIIREQNVTEKSVQLLCCRGDLMNDPDQYKKAFLQSRSRSARALCSLGGVLAGKQRYFEASDVYDRALSLQPLGWTIWLARGKCALRMNDFHKAITCYGRCIEIEPCCNEAWQGWSAAVTQLSKQKLIYNLVRRQDVCVPEILDAYVSSSFATRRFGSTFAAIRFMVESNLCCSMDVLRCIVHSSSKDVDVQAYLPRGFKSLLRALVLIQRRSNSERVRLLKLYCELCLPCAGQVDLFEWNFYADLCACVVRILLRTQRLSEDNLRDVAEWAVKTVDAKLVFIESSPRHSHGRSVALMFAISFAKSVLRDIEGVSAGLLDTVHECTLLRERVELLGSIIADDSKRGYST
uniref:TPR_REGION domain-containing protein n=1 Tax=Trichuris muris TaxID=70415 RepID=A0A5S6Q7Z7_TRIMR